MSRTHASPWNLFDADVLDGAVDPHQHAEPHVTLDFQTLGPARVGRRDLGDEDRGLDHWFPGRGILYGGRILLLNGVAANDHNLSGGNYELRHLGPGLCAVLIGQVVEDPLKDLDLLGEVIGQCPSFHNLEGGHSVLEGGSAIAQGESGPEQRQNLASAGIEVPAGPRREQPSESQAAKRRSKPALQEWRVTSMPFNRSTSRPNLTNEGHSFSRPALRGCGVTRPARWRDAGRMPALHPRRVTAGSLNCSAGVQPTEAHDRRRVES